MVYSYLWRELPRELIQSVDSTLISRLSSFDIFAEGHLVIHRLLDPSAGDTSQHRLGFAADCHIEGLSVLDQYLMAERFNFGGVGVYGRDVWTRTPGLHLDTRPDFPCKKWGCRIVNGKRAYVALDREFFLHLLKEEFE